MHLSFQSISMGSIHQNGDRLREPKVGDTRRPAAGPGSRRWVDRLCRQYERRASSCPTIIFHCRSLPVIPRCGHQMCSVLFLWGTWLEKQAETTEGYLFSELGMSRSITDHRSRSRVRTSFLYMHCEPQELFLLLLLCQPFYISQVSLFLFSFFSSIVALHKHWRMLDHLTASSACFGDGRNSPLAARFRSRRSYTCWLWTFSQRTVVWF